MPHSYSICLFHIVFSTKGRERLVTSDVRERLHAYLAGIACENDMKAFASGGTEDHVHVLLSLPATIAVAKAVRLIKGGASRWVRETFPNMREFAWQEGYGAFSIGKSGVGDTIAYIRNQKEHHRVKTFEEEFTTFLTRHGLEYDERYVFG